MTENEKFDIILLEIRGMKTEMQEMKSEMKTEMQGMKSDIQSLKQEVIDLKQRVSCLEQRVDDLDRKVAGIGLHIENSTDRNIQLVAENFIELTQKLNEAIPVANKNLAYEVKVNYLVCEVDKLKKEVAELRNKIA